ncbi:hypothetical protein [Paraburkholderia sp. CNPSo 3274]|nr:hypothetical protein [Paraburkholderia sp. CNPSo 3274]
MATMEAPMLQSLEQQQAQWPESIGHFSSQTLPNATLSRILTSQWAA